MRSIKLLLFLACTSAILCGCRSAADTGTYYENPVVRQEAPDPSVFRDKDGTFYLYATGGNYSIFKSKDMINWERVGTVFSDETFPKLIRNGRKPDLWAPEIRVINDKYVIFYTLWFGRCWLSCIGYAVSDTPVGPFVDKGILIDSEAVNVEQSIDQFYFEDKGKSYLFWGSFRNIYVTELDITDDVTIRMKPETMHQFAGNAYEGSNIWKHGKYYYYFASVGDYSGGANSTYRTVVARSKNLMGPYLDRNGVDIMQNGYEELLDRNSTFAGPGHNAGLIQDDAGQVWMFYHAYELSRLDLHRQGMLDKVEWDKDGWPYISDGTPSTKAKAPVIRPRR